MNTTIKTALVFAAGVVAGFLISYKWNEKKWMAKADEDIKSARNTHEIYRKEYMNYRANVREKYGDEEDRKFVHDAGFKALDNIEKTNEVLSESTKSTPTGYEKAYEEHPAHARELSELPYVIKPEEYQKEEGYDVRTLTYQRDEQRLFDPGDPLTLLDTRTILGEDVMEYLTVQWGTDGEYDDDIIYVVDDIVRIYYALAIE